MKERGGETEVNVNCSAFVSFFFLFLVLEVTKGKKKQVLVEKS